MPIVDLITAKERLRITDDRNDVRLAQCLEEASAVVTKYCKKPEGYWDIAGAGSGGETGTDADLPPWDVQAAVLLATHELFDGGPQADPLTTGVKSLLHMYRDPALA
jgi:hypothetical protein